jgi:hypothetical protein
MVEEGGELQRLAVEGLGATHAPDTHSNLPRSCPTTDSNDLEGDSDKHPRRLIQFFGQIGQIKPDKKSRVPNAKKVWIYKDKSTGKPKGDATVSYLDPNGAK